MTDLIEDIIDRSSQLKLVFDKYQDKLNKVFVENEKLNKELTDKRIMYETNEMALKSRIAENRIDHEKKISDVKREMNEKCTFYEKENTKLKQDNLELKKENLELKKELQETKNKNILSENENLNLKNRVRRAIEKYTELESEILQLKLNMKPSCDKNSIFQDAELIQPNIAEIQSNSHINQSQSKANQRLVMVRGVQKYEYDAKDNNTSPFKVDDENENENIESAIRRTVEKCTEFENEITYLKMNINPSCDENSKREEEISKLQHNTAKSQLRANRIRSIKNRTLSNFSAVSSNDARNNTILRVEVDDENRPKKILLLHSKSGQYFTYMDNFQIDSNWPTIVVLNSSLLLFGGQKDSDSQIKNKFIRVNLLTKQIIQMEDMKEKRQNFSCSVLGDAVYVIGGVDYNDQLLQSVEMWHSKYNRWEKKSHMNTKRKDHTSVTYSGKIYVFGGCDEKGVYFRSIEIYDPVTNKWEIDTTRKYTGDRKEISISPTFATVHGEYIYVCESILNSGKYATLVNKFDPSTRQWTQLPPIPKNQYCHHLVSFNNNIIFFGNTENFEFEMNLNLWKKINNQERTNRSLLLSCSLPVSAVNAVNFTATRTKPNSSNESLVQKDRLGFHHSSRRLGKIETEKVVGLSLDTIVFNSKKSPLITVPKFIPIKNTHPKFPNFRKNHVTARKILHLTKGIDSENDITYNRNNFFDD